MYYRIYVSISPIFPFLTFLKNIIFLFLFCIIYIFIFVQSKYKLLAYLEKARKHMNCFLFKSIIFNCKKKPLIGNEKNSYTNFEILIPLNSVTASQALKFSSNSNRSQVYFCLIKPRFSHTHSRINNFLNGKCKE